ncbi:MAG: OmpA family protein [Kofleriaceae bacterium]|jgi:OOP family OmpA-OmpF porin|nr:OmpA family protein [Kofleriaceae bacterium]MBP9172484.1 OmpA family protein [Kofleriaceae bacterium]MBP9862340.1 OmpA family protein [Kofleriaceae bacterium]
MSTRGTSSLAGAICALGLTGTAAAQSAPPYDPAIDVQLFDYAIGPKAFFAVSDAGQMAPKQITFDFLVTFLSNPFTVYNVDDADDEITGERTQVVKSVLAGELSAAYGLNDRFQLGVALPMIFQMTGDGLMPATAGPDPEGLRVSGTGDLRAEVKMQAFRKDALAGAVAVGATLPTSFGSGGGRFIGDDLPSLRGRGMVQWTGADGKLTVGANLGLIFRKPRTIYASTVGQQLTWGAAASYRPVDRFALVAETFGRTGLGQFDLDQSPMEVEGGARVNATQAIAVVIGGGTGVVRGIGSPDLRLFASIGYAPDTRDSDEDGVANNRDRCPNQAEDRDGWEDGDGCPDDDNDNDRRDDARDKCPDKSEDFDGWDDDDGCPETDNDGDSFADLEDKCPMDPEDSKQPFPKDGCPADKHDADRDGLVDTVDQCPADPEDKDAFDDGDGCPDPDQDGDGVADEDDTCPLCAEDKDGWEDADGCPEADNDNDGLADAADQCPNEPESVNGYDDLDGCSDDGGALLIDVSVEDRLGFVRTPTFDRRGLDRGGGIIVDQLALTMLPRREVKRWTLAVVAKTKAEADRQAGWVLDRLVSRGVDRASVTLLTDAGAPTMGVLVADKLDAAPGPSCPPGSEVQPKGRGAAPPAPAAAPTTTTTAPGMVDTLDAANPEPAPPPPPADRDGDGLDDAGDRCPDELETKNGYQDDDGCPDTVPAPLKQFSGTVKGINFKKGSAEIERKSFKVLDKSAAALLGFPDLKVEIGGHTDDQGDDDANLALSQARADSVRAYLIGKGVGAERLVAKGYGETAPTAPIEGLKRSKLRAARAKNRRVEFKLQ